MNRKRTQLFGVIALVIIVVIAGLILINKSGSSKMTTTSSSAAASAVATNTVTIQNYMFSPMAIKVKVGAKVTWTNKDDVHHSITADSGSMPNSPLFGQNETYSYTFTKAGTYTYHCMPHPYMHGTVIVTN